MIRLLALMAALLFSLPARAQTVTLVADSWCPYNCAPGTSRPGFMVEIAQKAFSRNGLTVEYITMPWTKALADTRAGKYTAVVGASHDDAPDFVYPTLEQGWMQNRFYVKKGNPWRYKDITSLAGVPLGVVADYSYNDELDAYLKKNKGNAAVAQVASGDSALDVNFKKLQAGQISAVVEDRHVMEYYLSEHRARDQVELAGIAPSTKDDNLYIAFSPKHPKAQEYASIIAQQVRMMRSTGELQQLLNSYGLQDWKE